MTNSREAAYTAVTECLSENAWSSQIIDSIIKRYSLNHMDASLASYITLGVLQNLFYLDYYIDLFCSFKKPEQAIKNILRIGAFQILFCDKIPDSAAVNESVFLCKRFRRVYASGFVNAVLRQICRNKKNLPEIPGAGTADYLSIKYSHNIDLCTYLVKKHGYDFTEKFLKSNNDIKPVYAHLNSLKTDLGSFLESLDLHGIKYELCPVISNCIMINGSNVTQLPGFSAGLFYIQDPAPRIAVSIAGPRSGMKVLDVCSAPGGKSFASAIDMNNVGTIIACDINPKKLNLVEAGASRLGIDIIKCCAMDGKRFYPEFEKKFDLVIADVPCSGFGTIGKKPEIRFKNLKSLSTLPELQFDILKNVSNYVSPGGVLLYSTCTVMNEENEDVVMRFLRNAVDFKLEDFNPESEGTVYHGMRTFWPHLDNTDGFFVAKLLRTE